MKKRVIPFIIGGAIALAVIASGLSDGSVSDLFGLLSDACFVPGVLLSGIGMLLRIGEVGVFDMLAYGVSGITRVFFGREQDSYNDYKKKRQERSLSNDGLFLAGGVYLFLAVVFFLLLGV